MARCDNTLCDNDFDPDETESCAFCSKFINCCPECLGVHEEKCAENEKLENDYANDPHNER